MMGDLAADRREKRRALHHLEAWIETPMIALSFVWLTLVIIELIWGAGQITAVLGIVIWIVFILEFTLRMVLAPAKLAFVRRNWLTVVALFVPALRMFTALRFLRVARAARGIRLVRVVGTANRGMNALRQSLGRQGLGYVIVLTILIGLLGGAGMLAFEPAAEMSGGFTNYADALWWTAMLLATMGTDFWPRTAEGRILCLLLAIYGFAVWGYITASLATYLLGQEARSAKGDIAGAKEIAALAREIALVREALAHKRS